MISWTHADGRGLAAAASAALARLGTATPWGSSSGTEAEQVADFRGLVVASLTAAASRTSSPPNAGSFPDLPSADYPSDTDARMAAGLCRTWAILSGNQAIDTSVSTVGGGGAGLAVSTDGGAWTAPDWLTRATTISIAGLLGGWLAALAYISGDIVRMLATDSDRAELVAAQAAAVDATARHADRERAAGGPVPWTPDELATLTHLEEVQKRLAEKMQALSLVPDSLHPWAWCSSIAAVAPAALKRAKELAAEGLAGVGGLALFAAAAWVAWKLWK